MDIETIIRPAVREDLPAIARLSRSLALHVNDPDPGEGTVELREAVFGERPWADALIACRGSNVIGFALFCRRFEAHTRKRTLWLADLVVSANARNEGVGRRLVEGVREEAQRFGCAGVSLEVWKHNATASAFYRRLGVTKAEEVDLFFIQTR